MRRLAYLALGVLAVLYDAAVVAARLLDVVPLTAGAVLLSVPVLAGTAVLALMLVRLRRGMRSLKAPKPELDRLDKRLTALSEQYENVVAAATAAVNDARRLLRERRVVVLEAYALWHDRATGQGVASQRVGSQP